MAYLLFITVVIAMGLGENSRASETAVRRDFLGELPLASSFLHKMLRKVNLVFA